MAIRRDARDSVGRFKPGASGNPKGRPKVSTKTNPPEVQRDLIYDVAEHNVAVTINGRKLSLPLLEANLLTLGIMGANGNSVAARQFVQVVNAARGEEISAMRFMHDTWQGSEPAYASELDPALRAKMKKDWEDIWDYIAGRRNRYEGPLRKAARRRK